MLQRRSELLRCIRNHFYSSGALEVDVPVLASTTVSDPHIQSFQVDGYFLQTSPEFYIKKLLSNISQDVFYLGKAFRLEEAGRKHSAEFTMLEWYRMGWNEQQLIEDVFQLIGSLTTDIEPEKMSYEEVFVSATGVNPHTCSASQLQLIAKDRLEVTWESEPKNFWLDLLFTHLVEPLFKERLVAVYDFPESQCALARIQRSACGSYPVAKRFEIYWDGVELANGYYELTDAEEQRQRFLADNVQREQMGLPVMPIDSELLVALENGIPECAGVALGVDRLLMCLTKENDIKHVMPFSING